MGDPNLLDLLSMFAKFLHFMGKYQDYQTLSYLIGELRQNSSFTMENYYEWVATRKFSDGTE